MLALALSSVITFSDGEERIDVGSCINGRTAAAVYIMMKTVPA